MISYQLHDLFINLSSFIFLLPADEFLVSSWALFCSSAVCLTEKLVFSSVSRCTGNLFPKISFVAAFLRMGSCSQSARHTNPDQIRCHLTSFSVEELNVHHGATGIHYWAVGTLNAIACYVAIDVNDFCHMEAKDKLLLIMLEDV